MGRKIRFSKKTNRGGKMFIKVFIGVLIGIITAVITLVSFIGYAFLIAFIFKDDEMSNIKFIVLLIPAIILTALEITIMFSIIDFGSTYLGVFLN